MMVALRQLPLLEGFKPIVLMREEKKRVLVGKVLHLGAGVQSSCLAEMIVEGELPRVDLVIFCDTGNEPAWVYTQVSYLKTRFASVNIPFIIKKKAGLGIIDDAKRTDHRFASMPLFTRDSATGRIGRLRRQCTTEYKVLPSNDYLREWLLERGYAYRRKNQSRVVKNNIYIENWYGISSDETYRAGKRGPGWQQANYPLIERGMSRQGCVEWLKSHKLPVPKKSSCKVCAYHDDAYWLWMAADYPGDFEEVCQFDDWLRSPEAKAQRQIKGLRQSCYLHQSCIPLREVDFTASKRRNISPFQRELIEGATCSTDGGFTCMS